MDVRATKINEAMKKGLRPWHWPSWRSNQSRKHVNIAYGETRFTFGKDYIIPKPFDHRLIGEIPPAVAKAAIESGVAQSPIEDWDLYREDLLKRTGGENKVIRLIMDRGQKQS